MNDIDIDISTISPKEIKNYVFVDIREEDELFHSPSIAECPHVPMSQFPSNMSFFNTNDNYLIFCAKGGRSHHIAEILQSQGIKAMSVNYGVSAVNSYLKGNASA